MEQSAPKASRGLTAELLSLWGSAGRHIQALVELAGIEGREALALYLRLAIMLAAALIFLLLGYIFIIIFVAFLVATIFGVSWLWISLALALLHLLVCFLCATHVRAHFKSPVFAATSAELRRDFEALKSSRP